MQHRPYRRNYSPIKYEKDDIPALFAAASREGIRRPTFIEDEAETAPAFRVEARDVHAVMDAYELEDSTPPVQALHSSAIKKHNAAKGRSGHVSPWFALSSGMVVAGALVMTLVMAAPENVVPKGAIAKLVSDALTATVIFSR